MVRTTIAWALVLSVGCDRPPRHSTPGVTPPNAAGPTAVEPPPFEAKPPPPMLLTPAAAPAVDRRDGAVRRSLDPADCPNGTTVHGRAPPHGIEQYCADGAGTRFGPARFWPESALPSRREYMPGKNFRPIRAAHYHAGELHGPILTWGPNGLRVALERYHLGVPVGIWVTWNEQGHVVSQRNFFQREAPLPPELLAQVGSADRWQFGRTHLQTEFFAHGKASSQRIRTGDGRELLAGMRTWYENGQLRCRADQLPGRVPEHVSWVCYYDDGVTREEGAKRDGKRHGDWSEWSRSGALRSRGSYFDGKRTGTWEWVARGKRRTQTYDIPIAQTLDALPKAWTRAFQTGDTVVIKPGCDGVARTITVTPEHLIVAGGEGSGTYAIESVERTEATYSFVLADRQSIRVLHEGEGTAAIWKEPSEQLVGAAGVYVPTSRVPKLRVDEPQDCPTRE